MFQLMTKSGIITKINMTKTKKFSIICCRTNKSCFETIVTKNLNKLQLQANLEIFKLGETKEQ